MPRTRLSFAKWGVWSLPTGYLRTGTIKLADKGQEVVYSACLASLLPAFPHLNKLKDRWAFIAQNSGCFPGSQSSSQVVSALFVCVATPHLQLNKNTHFNSLGCLCILWYLLPVQVPYRTWETCSGQRGNTECNEKHRISKLQTSLSTLLWSGFHFGQFVCAHSIGADTNWECRCTFSQVFLIFLHHGCLRTSVSWLFFQHLGPNPSHHRPLR